MFQSNCSAYHGPEACLHLMSIISIVDERLAVAYLPLLPVLLLNHLREREIWPHRGPEEEFETTMGTNILALPPASA